MYAVSLYGNFLSRPWTFFLLFPFNTGPAQTLYPEYQQLSISEREACLCHETGREDAKTLYAFLCPPQGKACVKKQLHFLQQLVAVIPAQTNLMLSDSKSDSSSYSR